MSDEPLTAEQQRALRLGGILLKNPEIALEAKRLAKKADPTLQIPEVEIDDKIATVREASKKDIEKLEGELLNERVARRKAERDTQIREAGFKVEDIEKIIVDRKCTYETALHIASLEQRTSEPTTSDNGRSNPPGTPIEMRPEKTWRGLFGGALRQKSADIAHGLVDEFRNTRRAGAK